jgi:Succinylglutamate desuccinylase / Aspartoacylase family
VLRSTFELKEYGQLVEAANSYALCVLHSRQIRDNLPCILVTGGVHGYETSGVHGALLFAQQHAQAYEQHFNIFIAPCVSPWAYERVQRWNAQAVDPNRSFRESGTPRCEEASALMRFMAPFQNRIALHIDLHETTNSDESEFRPALAARDGKVFEPGHIPDGFYVVADAQNPQLEFQKAIIARVSKVTHIAPSDAAGRLIGTPVLSPGVVQYAYRQLGLCAGFTNATFTTTTEVYPDSPSASPSQCNAAQVESVCAALDFAIESRR